MFKVAQINSFIYLRGLSYEKSHPDLGAGSICRDTRFFYKEHLYKELEAEIN